MSLHYLYTIFAHILEIKESVIIKRERSVLNNNISSAKLLLLDKK